MSAMVNGWSAWVPLTAENDGAGAPFDPSSVTPGVIGFVVTALFALAVIFLGLDLVRRLRRSRYREQIAEELQTELESRAHVEGEAAPDAQNSESGENKSGDDSNPHRPIDE